MGHGARIFCVITPEKCRRFTSQSASHSALHFTMMACIDAQLFTRSDDELMSYFITL